MVLALAASTTTPVSTTGVVIPVPVMVKVTLPDAVGVPASGMAIFPAAVAKLPETTAGVVIPAAPAPVSAIEKLYA
jgi:hypothetical protein